MTAPEDLTGLCLSCGLCCDGSLFDAVLLTDDEARSPLWAHRATIRAGSRPGRARHPCVWLEGCRCSVYPERPASCRAYECRLYTEVASGDVSVDAAYVEVAEMKVALASVTDRLPPDDRGRAFLVRLKQAAFNELEHPGAGGRVTGFVDDLVQYRVRRERFLPASP